MPAPGLSVRITVDEFTPWARWFEESFRRPDRILVAVGEKVVEITRRAFNEEALRAAPWPPLRDGSASNLTQTGALYESIGIIDIGGTAVTVGVRPISRGGAAPASVYAAAHQFGVTITPKQKKVLVFTAPDGTKVFAKKVTIPARPFFPVTEAGQFTPFAKEEIARIVQDRLRPGNVGS